MDFRRFIGDIHGKMHAYTSICDCSPYPTIQVGDYGMGFVDNWILPSQAKQHRFIRGNHDNPAVCKQQHNYIEDGTIEDGIMFIGGADSIDKHWRKSGVDWWEDEQLSYQELSNLLDIAREAKPNVMVTHEAPDFIADYICQSRGWQKYLDDDRTRKAFDVLYGQHQPKLHIFGHWHIDLDMIYQDTRFICLNELSYIDIDIDDPHNLDFMIEKYQKFS